MWATQASPHVKSQLPTCKGQKGMIGCLGPWNTPEGFEARQRLSQRCAIGGGGLRRSWDRGRLSSSSALHCDTCDNDEKGKMGDDGWRLTAEGLTEGAW